MEEDAEHQREAADGVEGVQSIAAGHVPLWSVLRSLSSAVQPRPGARAL
jgi:hypothetical protein